MPTLSCTEAAAEPGGRIMAQPPGLSFGKIPGSIIAVVSLPLILRNSGPGRLVIHHWIIAPRGQPDCSAYFRLLWPGNLEPERIVLDVGQEVRWTIELVAKELGRYQAVLLVSSSDLLTPELRIPLEALRSMY